MSSKGAIVVFGSGPGIGRSTAAYFAEKGFKHVVLLSRDTSRLAEDAKFVSSAASDAKVQTLKIDLAADEDAIKSVLREVANKLKAEGVPLEVVLYNAARVGPSKLLEFETKRLEEDIRITTFSLYTTLKWAIPQLLETAKSESYNPAFLTTSGGLYRDPYPHFFSLSASKASQHNLMFSFHKKYEPQIHVACVPVNGVVSDDAKVTSSRAVAAQFWKMYEQKKGVRGENSVEMDDPDYEDMIEGVRKSVEGD